MTTIALPRPEIHARWLVDLADPAAARRRRPEGVSRQLWLRYLSAFWPSIRFWTSVDGDAGPWVITPQVGAVAILARESERPVTDADLQTGWVEWTWADREFWDDPSPGARRRGKAWSLTTEPTPFPVVFFDPRG